MATLASWSEQTQTLGKTNTSPIAQVVLTGKTLKQFPQAETQGGTTTLPSEGQRWPNV